MSLFEFQDGDALGKVATVDTSTVVVDVFNLEQLKRLQVNRLTVLQSSKPGQHLIGLINKVTRKKLDADDIDDDQGDHVNEQNLCRISLIGTFAR